MREACYDEPVFLKRIIIILIKMKTIKQVTKIAVLCEKISFRRKKRAPATGVSGQDSVLAKMGQDDLNEVLPL